ncbi:MAG: TonB-dependent receptor [Desulfuromonadales bacterium]|nr:TonB-dependent receptor [Desulfuromonadales bacterium]
MNFFVNIVPVRSLLSLALLLLTVPLAQAVENTTSGYNLGEITVTAERLDAYIRNYPQQVETVGSREIAERHLATTEEVLKTMPGVEGYQSSGSGSRISIRGSGRSSGVLVLLNGRPLNSNQYGNVDLNSVPVDQIESVTVFKPPVPVWLGSGGSDGAVNIVTRAAVLIGEGEQANTTLKLNGGSYGFVDGSLIRTLELFSGSAHITAGAAYQDGKRNNSDRDTGSLALNWNRETQSGDRYTLNSRYYEAEYGSAGPIDNPTPDARQRYRKGALDFGYAAILGESGSLEATLYGDLTTLRDRSQSGAIATLDEQKTGFKADTTWTPEDESWEGRLGVISEWDRIDQTLAGEHERASFGLSGQYDRRFGAWTTTLGLRGDNSSDFGWHPGLTSGIGWGVRDNLLIRVKAGYRVAVPSFSQLYQSAHGSIDQTRGNPDLKEERIWSYDLGIEYRPVKDVSLQATLFRNDTDDLINYQRGTDLIYRPVNIAGAWREGIELTGKLPLLVGLTSETSLILQHSENSATGKQLAYTPKLKIRQTVQYLIPGTKARLEGTFNYEGERYSQIENFATQKLGGYLRIDLKASTPLPVPGIKCDGYVKIDNLFDRRYQVHAGYPDDGIRFVTGLQAHF